MITIKRIYLEKANNKSRCICEIELKNEIKRIWFEVDEEYGEYLTTDRCDAYLIGILSYAMRLGEDIACEIPVTDELLFQINEILMPSLVKHSINLHTIKIFCDTIAPINEGKAVGTGLSCGVDSFWSVREHCNSLYSEFNITHLCINNVGAFNECYADYGIEKVKKERYEIARNVANELGIKLIITDSNFADIIEQNHLLTSTYSCCFAIYMLQKLWKIYYLASNGIDYAQFSLKNNDIKPSEQSELFVLQCFSISSLRIYCDGGGKNRFEKTLDISDYEPAQKYLHVCTKKPFNCGICSKCRRTLLSLDAMNKLDNFKGVFDIDYYRKNRSEYYKWLYIQHINEDIMNAPTYELLSKRHDYKVPLVFKAKKRLLKKIPKNFKESIKRFLKR